MSNVVTNNPNTSAATVGGALSVLAVWGVSLAGVNVPAEIGSAFSVLFIAVILFIGPLTRRPKPAPAVSRAEFDALRAQLNATTTSTASAPPSPTVPPTG